MYNSWIRVYTSSHDCPHIQLGCERMLTRPGEWFQKLANQLAFSLMFLDTLQS